MEPIWQHEIDIFAARDGVFVDIYKVFWTHEIKPEHKELVKIIDDAGGGPVPGVGFRLNGTWHRHFTYGVFV